MHGVPALLSLFFPGLGQLAKGQWSRAVFIWVALLAPWIGWTVAALLDPERPDPHEVPRLLMESPFFGVVAALTVAVWIWSVVDAYRHP